MNNAIIEVKNLTKVYSPKKNPVQALKGISFSVKKGEIFGILGPNGAGKSTTLNIIIGVLSPTTGSVKVFGKNLFAHEEEIKQRMNIATAYADLASNLSVKQNLKVYALMYDVKDYPVKIDNLMRRFSINDLRNQRIDKLSAGEKTRVNLCKGLINDPEILLLDEPTASLDPSIAAETRELLLKLQKKQSTTIIFTSHNMPEVEQMCDRVALLSRGLIYKIDTPENLKRLLKSPTLEQIFIRLAKGELEEI